MFLENQWRGKIGFAKGVMEGPSLLNERRPKGSDACKGGRGGVGRPFGHLFGFAMVGDCCLVGLVSRCCLVFAATREQGQVHTRLVITEERFVATEEGMIGSMVAFKEYHM
jgi:hypothetical protein